MVLARGPYFDVNLNFKSDRRRKWKTFQKQEHKKMNKIIGVCFSEALNFSLDFESI